MKGNKFILGVIVGIIVAALFGLCFYAGTKYAGDGKKEPEKVEKRADSKKEEKQTKDKEVKLDPESKEVDEARNLIPFVMCHGYAIELNGKSRTLNDLTDKEKLAIVMSYYTDKLMDQDGENGFSLVLEDKDLKYLFEDISFVDVLKKGEYSMDVRQVKLKDGKIVYTGYPTGCTAEEYKGYELSLYDAYKKGDTLKLIYAYPYEDTRFDEKKDDLVTDFYVSKEDKKPLYEAPEYNDEKQDFDVDWSKFNRYEVIIDTSDDNLRIQEFKYVEAK